MLSDMLPLCIRDQIHIYQSFPDAAIIYSDKVACCEGNRVAQSFYPELCEPQSFALLLEQLHPDTLLWELYDKGCAVRTATWEHRTLTCRILPIFQDGECFGLVLFPHAHTAAASVSDPTLSQLPTFFNAVIRESVQNISCAVDSLCIPAETPSPSALSIRQNCSRLLRLSNNLNMYMQLTGGIYQPVYCTQDFCEVLLACKPVVQKIADDMQISVSFSLPNMPCILQTDDALLQCALFNLLHNSFYFTRPGNAVTVSLTVKDGIYTLTVQDRGLGIEPDRIASVWEPYVSYDPCHRSLGLGLALVRKCMRFLNGTASLESVPKQGTTATLTFPARQSANVISFAQRTMSIPPEDAFSSLSTNLSDAALSPFRDIEL